jgi:TPR repeat protein
VRSPSFARRRSWGTRKRSTGMGGLFSPETAPPADPVAAQVWIDRAASAGVVEALELQGECLQDGIGREADPDKARTAFLAAAKANHEVALTNLGLMAEKGSGLEAPDYAEALSWYEKASALGHAPALMGQAALYRDGRGVERDLAQAAALYRQAAELGYAPAQSNLGVFFRQGMGVDRDLEKSVEWLTRAARQGNGPAMFNLAICHFRGEGTPVDQVEGFQWLLLAGQRGNAEAARLANEVRAFLPQETIDQGTQRAADFSPVSER